LQIETRSAMAAYSLPREETPRGHRHEGGPIAAPGSRRRRGDPAIGAPNSGQTKSGRADGRRIALVAARGGTSLGLCLSPLLLPPLSLSRVSVSINDEWIFSFPLIYFLSPPFACLWGSSPRLLVFLSPIQPPRRTYWPLSNPVWGGPYESATHPTAGRVGGLAPRVMTPPAFLTGTRAPAPRDLFAQHVTMDRVGPV
jgi:hypothetical protein